MTLAPILLTTTAHAETPAPGTFAIAGSLALNGGSTRGENRPTSRFWGITALPTVDLFVAGGLTLGAAASISYARANTSVYGGSSLTHIQPGVQVGYYLPIGEHAAFWPVVRASYGLSWADEPNAKSADPGSRTYELSLTPNVLLRPTKTFFVRLAPGILAYRATTISQNPIGLGMLGIGAQFALGVGVML